MLPHLFVMTTCILDFRNCAGKEANSLYIHDVLHHVDIDRIVFFSLHLYLKGLWLTTV